MIQLNKQGIVKWLKCAVALLFFTINSHAQVRVIQFENHMAEMTTFVHDEDIVFMAGTVPFSEDLKSYPALAAVNLSGDTLWTKIFKEYAMGGSFIGLIVHDDTLNALGYFKETEYSGRYALAKFTNMGELVSIIRLPSGYYKNSFTFYKNKFFISSEMEESEEKILYRLNQDLTLDTVVKYDILGFPNIESITTLNSPNLNSFIIQGEDKHYNPTFQVHSFDVKLNRQEPIFLEPNINCYDPKLIHSSANEYWFVARETIKGLDREYYLSVVSYDSTGKQLFQYQEPTEKGTTVCAVKETLTGDIIVLIKRNDKNSVMFFRDNKLHTSVDLDEITGGLPKEILEIRPGEFKIFGLGLSQIGSIAAYGTTFMYDFKIEL